MGPAENSQLKVYGATLQGFAQACVNLNIVAGRNAGDLLTDIEVDSWYPFERLAEMESLVIESYEDVGPILERVGMEMMLGWYNYGPGSVIISKGVDFLHFQTGSQGYASVVVGPEELVGSFSLEEVDLVNGRATIHSTTPFNKDLERGVIIGGLSAPGDLDFVDVQNSDDEHFFQIEFY